MGFWRFGTHSHAWGRAQRRSAPTERNWRDRIPSPGARRPRAPTGGRRSGTDKMVVGTKTSQRARSYHRPGRRRGARQAAAPRRRLPHQRSPQIQHGQLLHRRRCLRLHRSLRRQARRSLHRSLRRQAHPTQTPVLRPQRHRALLQLRPPRLRSSSRRPLLSHPPCLIPLWLRRLGWRRPVSRPSALQALLR